MTLTLFYQKAAVAAAAITLLTYPAIAMTVYAAVKVKEPSDTKAAKSDSDSHSNDKGKETKTKTQKAVPDSGTGSKEPKQKQDTHQKRYGLSVTKSSGNFTSTQEDRDNNVIVHAVNSLNDISDKLFQAYTWLADVAHGMTQQQPPYPLSKEPEPLGPSPINPSQPHPTELDQSEEPML